MPQHAHPDTIENGIGMTAQGAPNGRDDDVPRNGHGLLAGAGGGGAGIAPEELTLNRAEPAGLPTGVAENRGQVNATPERTGGQGEN